MNNRNLVQRKTLAALCSAALAVSLSTPALAGNQQQDWQGEMRDAWVDGKIEASFTLNPYLNPFAIDTRVDKGVVVLTGTVNSQVDKDLAAEIARSVDGVTEVVNEIEVRAEEEAASDEEREPTLGDRIDDATTTARVKYALLANDSTEGLQINVDTENGNVSLEGEVQSEQHRDLAEQIASNTEGVKDVENRLKVKDQS